VGRVHDRGLERRLVDRLAGVLVERRLRVERLQVADAAHEEQPDDPLRLRGEVRLAVGRGARPGGPDDAVAGEHRPEGEPGEAPRGVGEEGAAVHGEPPYRIVTKSLWFRSTWTKSSRARRAGSADGGVTASPAGNGVSFPGCA